MFDIPIQMFFGFIGFSIIMVALGLVAKHHWLLIIAGAFMLVWTTGADNISMGQLVSSSTTNSTSGNVITEYEYEDNSYQLTDVSKLLFALVSLVIMLIGSILIITSRDGDYPFGL